MKALRTFLTGLTIALFTLSSRAATLPHTGSIFNNRAFILHEEKYVDDIPFNTAKIFIEAQYQKAIHVKFTLPEEAYVNDIPFNTENIFFLLQAKNQLLHNN